jgi:hypothetical protein
LFRSLFHGRDDVYAVRWENADGRYGYMPKADRDWKAYLRAKDEDRKKVDRQTRKFRPLTDEVVRGHLVGDHTIGIYPLLQDETCWFLAVDFDKKTCGKLLFELFQPISKTESASTPSKEWAFEGIRPPAFAVLLVISRLGGHKIGAQLESSRIRRKWYRGN